MKLKKRKSLCAQCVNMPAKVSKKVVGMIIRSRKSIMKDGVITVHPIYFYSHFAAPLALPVYLHLSLSHTPNTHTRSSKPLALPFVLDNDAAPVFFVFRLVSLSCPRYAYRLIPWTRLAEIVIRVQIFVLQLEHGNRLPDESGARSSQILVNAAMAFRACLKSRFSENEN